MTLHQNRRLQRGGLPEFVAVLLVLLVVVFAFLWWTQGTRPDWPSTYGHVISCEIRPSHYNAPPSDKKVIVTYEYDVAGTSYVGCWEGYWPKGFTPNLLPDGNVEVLRHLSYPLVVLYDPSNASSSQLHAPPLSRSLWFLLLTLGSGALLAVYSFHVYPAWRERLNH